MVILKPAYPALFPMPVTGRVPAGIFQEQAQVETHHPCTDLSDEIWLLYEPGQYGGLIRLFLIDTCDTFMNEKSSLSGVSGVVSFRFC